MRQQRLGLAVAATVGLLMMPVAVRAHYPGAHFAGAGTATIDGQLAPGEWNGAASQPFTVYLPNDAVTTGMLFVMNDATNLYLAVQVDSSPSEPPLDELFVRFSFDNNHDNDLLGDDEIEGFFALSTGLASSEDYFWGLCPYQAELIMCSRKDVAEGGQNNVLAAMTHAGGTITAEISHPLHSGDSRDFSIAPGDVVGLKLGVITGVQSGGGTLRMQSVVYPPDNSYGDIEIVVTPTTIPIDVAIGNGSDIPCVNNNGRGVIPITIMGSSTLDVTEIDPSTLRLNSLIVKVVGPTQKSLVHYEDANADGFFDLVAQMQDVDGAFTTGQTTATITAKLLDGIVVSGTVPICVVR